MSETSSSTPVASAIRDEYAGRMAARQRTADALWETVKTLGSLRLLFFALFVAMAYMVTELKWFSSVWLCLPLAVFFALVFRYRDVHRAFERATRAARFYDDGLHRIDDDWIGRGVPGMRFVDPLHPYTGDLDIFGGGSIFELLCLARTRAGEALLADWLSAPASVAELLERQAAVAELKSALDLREDMAVMTAERGVIDSAFLASWGDRPVTMTQGWARVVAFIIGVSCFASLIYWTAGFSPRPFLILFAVAQVFSSFWREPLWDVLKGIDRPRRDLSHLADFLERLEEERFSSPLLARLRAPLDGNVRPSRRLRALITRMEYAEAWRNLFFVFFGLCLLWPLQFAFAIEAWRRTDGPRVRAWLDTLANMEALLSLSAFACEHPRDAVPRLDAEGPRFVGEGLGHPLIAQCRMICNDVRLDAHQRLMLVSGSNMAGKSSLLRTVGVNAVLALAGATVRARSLRLSPLAVGACMRVQDSLQQGVSHFYAEIKRLRQIVDLAEPGRPLPLLFLFDEILHGTNSYDRSIGAEAVVRTLLERGAVGLVTTHDLALTRMVEALQPRAINVHFQDELVDGKMSFDYTLRPGVVTRSNAIALMRAVGLEV